MRVRDRRGQIKLSIPIKRYVGEVDDRGYLRDPAKLIENKVVSKTAKIRIWAWDVDSTAPSGVLPERDLVTLNGEDIGEAQPGGSRKGAYLKGFEKQWSLNTFEIPIEYLRFPARGTDAKPLQWANNVLGIDVDTLDPQRKTWCVGVQWASISFDAMSPLMLVHGTNAQHTSWTEPIQGQTVVQHLTDLGIPFEYLIDMDPNGSAETNAKQLDNRVQEIVKQFGVGSVHFVGHSKGSTDIRFRLSSSTASRFPIR